MRRSLYSGLSFSLLGLASAALARNGPEIVVSVSSHVLVLHPAEGPEMRFPVATGRPYGAQDRGPRGTWFTGPDPRDPAFYRRRRWLPAYHRGQPFLRLSPVALRPHRSDPAYRRAARQPYGIHGAVTPSLLWGAVTAGCVRMRRRDLRRLYTYCRNHPGIPVRYTREPISLRRRSPSGACPEAALGVRPLREARLGRVLHGRICGGVDQWFSIDLQGGDVLSVALQHEGRLRLELFGIRAISAVARGRSGIRYRVPVAARNRGARYVRIVAPPRGVFGYSLTLRRLR